MSLSPLLNPSNPTLSHLLSLSLSLSPLFLSPLSKTKGFLKLVVLALTLLVVTASAQAPKPPLEFAVASPPLLRPTSSSLPASPSTTLEFAAVALHLALEFAVNIDDSPGLIQLLINSEDLVATIIHKVLKEYGRQRSIPVLDGHPEALDLCCAAINRTLSSSAATRS